MNCYYHPNQPAIGMCKHCQRGLCMECAAQVEDVLACRNRHEEIVHQVEQATARSILISQRAGTSFTRNAIFYGLAGLLFAGFGLSQLRFMGWQAIFLILTGAFLLYASIANYIESLKLK